MVVTSKTLEAGIVRPNGERVGQLTCLAHARSLRAAIALREFYDATGGVDEFLFAGEKWMAGRADTDSNIAPGRAGVIHRAARANDVGLVILWMDA